jgi:hypothetical protein
MLCSMGRICVVQQHDGRLAGQLGGYLTAEWLYNSTKTVVLHSDPIRSSELHVVRGLESVLPTQWCCVGAR